MKISTIVTLWLLGVNASAVSAQYTMLRLRGSTTPGLLTATEEIKANDIAFVNQKIESQNINGVPLIQNPHLTMFPVSVPLSFGVRPLT